MSGLKDELMKPKKLKDKLENETFNIVLKQCIKKMKFDSNNASSSVFEIPIFIPQKSLFNTTKCAKYIIKKLTKEKLECFLIKERTIYISWKKDNKTEKNNKKLIDHKCRKEEEENLKLINLIAKK